MQTTSSTPDWAIELVEQVCKDYDRALPTKLQWYDKSKQERAYRYTLPDGTRGIEFRRRRNTSGTTWASGKIHISSGTSEVDQRLVLLHELAHHILNKTAKGRKQGHTLTFWRLAFGLYHQYGVDLYYSYKREKDYKVKASQAYHELAAKLNMAE